MTQHVSIGVTGMTCNHCVGAVTSEVMKLEGVTQVDIDLAPDGVSQVAISSESLLDLEQVALAIEDAGYEMSSERD
jgi:copper chaperone CopZ